PLQVVSLYVDQRPDGDLSRQRAADHGFTIYPTIADALRCGGSKLAVDGVVIIGEHGKLDEALIVGVGGSDPMDYHALEAMQCMIERRRGGETGIKSEQMIEGDAVWR